MKRDLARRIVSVNDKYNSSRYIYHGMQYMEGGKGYGLKITGEIPWLCFLS
jgi:hypothetical protein